MTGLLSMRGFEVSRWPFAADAGQPLCSLNAVSFKMRYLQAGLKPLKPEQSDICEKERTPNLANIDKIGRVASAAPAA